jgi:F-type H+-transporting ATPase subunit b
MNILLAAEEHAAENAFWLPHDPWEIFWGTLAFAIVAILLWKFAKTPAADALKNRTAGVEETLNKARAEREAAEAECEQIRAALADSDSEAARIREDARQASETLKVEIAAKAEADVANARERAVIDLAATRTQMSADLSGELSRLSLGAAEKVVETSLDDASQQRLIDDYISQLGNQN